MVLHYDIPRKLRPCLAVFPRLYPIQVDIINSSDFFKCIHKTNKKWVSNVTFLIAKFLFSLSILSLPTSTTLPKTKQKTTKTGIHISVNNIAICWVIQAGSWVITLAFTLFLSKNTVITNLVKLPPKANTFFLVASLFHRSSPQPTLTRIILINH